MTVQVRDNNTNTIITKVNTNDWAKMFVTYIDSFRREYTNATIEVFYGEPNNKPVSTYRTFH